MQIKEMKVYSVSELVAKLRNCVENAFPLPIWVEGEVSNFSPAPSGHIYFCLKDEYSLIHCVVWKENRGILSVEISDGKKIRVLGEVRVYAQKGRYELVVTEIIPVGLGELQIKFEYLKRKLQKEGLFDESHKKPIPSFVERLGIVTSLDGAAIYDMINIARERYPGIEIIVHNARVQGDGAALEIAKAIANFNKFNNVDVIIVGRGGGSIEDLWCFNEEIVARAIYNSKIPIISAVGHEVDYTIADFVADKRASTPSKAIPICVVSAKDELEKLNNFSLRMNKGLLKIIDIYKNKINAIENRYGMRRLKDLINMKYRSVDDLSFRLNNSFKNYLNLLKERINGLSKRLENLNPRSVLLRGYTICYKLPEKKIVKSRKEIVKNDKIEVEFFDGKKSCEVLDE